MWAHPEFLWLGFLIPVLLALGWAFERRRLRDMRRWMDPALWARYGQRLRVRWERLFMLALALVSAWIALLGPLGKMRLRHAPQRGPDVVVAFDLSLSMYAQDGAPTRLEQARQAVRLLLEALPEARWGLVAFAGTAFPQCPLVSDPEPIRLLLDALDPSWMPVQGTDFGAALARAQELFSPLEGPRARAIVLVSDGEDHENRYGPVLRELQRARIPVFTVGVGSSEPVPIPLPEASPPERYKRDRSGAEVRTRLEADRLRTIAQQTGGRYLRAEHILELAEALRQLPGQFASVRARYERDIHVAPFLILSLLGWWGYWYGFRLPVRGGAALFALLFWGASAAQAQVIGLPGEDPQALADFQAGVAAYRAGRYEEAAAYFESALRRFRLPENQARAAYNAGNAWYRSGKAQAALQAYRQALMRGPEREVRFNYEWVWRQLSRNKSPAVSDTLALDALPRPRPYAEAASAANPAPQGPEQIDRATAERLLESLREQEARTLDRVQRRLARAAPRRPERDW
ncbi:MAG: VWA domain-containing protein [Bacteroidota bacterium]|nr:VWA domain-containing protein [Rhodothermia bacterium]MDW8285104.1 VWA domain-containing protein [Bacteroidota bacterium]